MTTTPPELTPEQMGEEAKAKVHEAIGFALAGGGYLGRVSVSGYDAMVFIDTLTSRLAKAEQEIERLRGEQPDVWDMWMCESKKLDLHEGQAYRFRYHPECETCQATKAEYDEAWRPNGMTEAETAATASVAGLVNINPAPHAEPPLHSSGVVVQVRSGDAALATPPQQKDVER